MLFPLFYKVGTDSRKAGKFITLYFKSNFFFYMRVSFFHLCFIHLNHPFHPLIRYLSIKKERDLLVKYLY